MNFKFVLFYLLPCTYFNICSGITYDFKIYGSDLNGYYIKLQIGTPLQAANVVIDTGSSNLAVISLPGTNASSFSCSTSQTLEKLDKNVEIRYERGRWSGYFAKDFVMLDNKPVKFIFSCMENQSQIFSENSYFQGILGLAYSAITVPDSSVETFFDTLVKNENINDVFSVYLGGPFFSSSYYGTEHGQIHMGYISTDFVRGKVVYTPIIHEGYFEVMLTNLKVDSEAMPMSCGQLNNEHSIIDTGTTELRLPLEIFYWTIHKIRSKISYLKTRDWMTNTSACTSKSNFDISDFPPITISFYNDTHSEFDIVISPEQYVILIESYYEVCFILSLDVSRTGTLIGSSILKGFYVVFDRQNKRVGFSNVTNVDANNTYGIVTNPYKVPQDLNSCKAITSQYISAITGVLLCGAIGFSLAMLYMLLSWIKIHLLKGEVEGSDTSSLVDEHEFKDES